MKEIAYDFHKPFLDFLHQVSDATAQINQQIGWGHEVLHELEQLEEVLVVPRGHEAHRLEVGCEDVGVLVDGAVLHAAAAAPDDLLVLLKAAAQGRRSWLS